MTANTPTPDERITCEHHWVSHHQPGLPIPWIEQCSLCGWFNSMELGRQIALEDYVVRAERDALAAVIEQAQDWHDLNSPWIAEEPHQRLLGILSTAPATALAQVKAEAWDEGSLSQYPLVMVVERYVDKGNDTFGVFEEPLEQVQSAKNPYRIEREAQ